MRPFSRAAILAVGSELLTPLRTDTNSLYITEQLNSLGIEVIAKAVAGDDRVELARTIESLLSRVDLLVLTGGLGPTDDDVTRDVVADVLHRTLSEDEALTARMRARFAARGLAGPMPEINRRQAMVPAGAEVIENSRGSAPGLWLEDERCTVVLLPGPPRELRPMLASLMGGALPARASGAALVRRVLRIVGRIESETDQMLQPRYHAWQHAAIPVTATILAALGQIELYLSARAPSRDEADEATRVAAEQVEALLGEDVCSTDGRTLEVVVGELLVSRQMRIALAESCTGGLVTSRLTDVPGSSRYVDRAVVAYDNEAKIELLGVPPETIAEHGAVSEAVAVAMAEGMRLRARVEIAVAVTGIAGPDGGSPEKPVGTVVIAVSMPGDTRVRLHRFAGEREQVKYQASQAALDAVRRMLLGTQRPTATGRR